MGLGAFALDKYTAAVYEHSVILPKSTTKPVSSEEALKLMNKNMDILEEAVKTAAKQVWLPSPNNLHFISMHIVLW